MAENTYPCSVFVPFSYLSEYIQAPPTMSLFFVCAKEEREGGWILFPPKIGPTQQTSYCAEKSSLSAYFHQWRWGGGAGTTDY